MCAPKRSLPQDPGPPLNNLRAMEEMAMKIVRDIENELMKCLFEPHSINTKQGTEKQETTIDEIVIESGDEIKFKDGSTIILKDPFRRPLNLPIKITKIKKRNESILEFIPYESKRPTFKKGISSSQMVGSLVKEIESYIQLFWQWQNGHTPNHNSWLKETRKYKNFKKWLYNKKNLKRRREELNQAIKDILVENTEGITSNRMAWHYVATILFASGIETDDVKKVFYRLQSKYR